MDEPASAHASGSLVVEAMTPAQRRWTFVLVCVELFVGQLGYAVMFPFFPGEADDKGLSSGLVGWIFGVFQLVVVICTPISAKMIPRYGPTWLLNSSNFLIANANILFGFVWLISSPWLFAVCCIALRAILGVGVAIAMTTGYALLPYLFGDRLSTGAGILETVMGIAFIAAPVLGAQLYNLGGGADKLGFVVPFIVLGGVQDVLGVYCLFRFPSLPKPEDTNSSLYNFSPWVLVPCSICTISAAAMEFTGPNLEPFLAAAPFHMSVSDVGWVYAVCSLVYTFLGPLVGMLDDKFEGKHAQRFMGFGIVALGFSFLQLGPAAWITRLTGLERSPTNLWISICIIGIGSAFGLIPTYNNIYNWGMHGNEDDTAAATSALYNMVYAFGGFLGPTLAGWLGSASVMGEDAIAESYSLFGAVCMIMGLIFFLMASLPVNSARRIAISDEKLAASTSTNFLEPEAEVAAA